MIDAMLYVLIRRFSSWSVLVLVALLLSACGSDGDGNAAGTVERQPTSASSPPVRVPSSPPPQGSRARRLTIHKQSDPPPKHIEIVDLRKGTGPTLKGEGSVDVRWFQVTYPEVRKRSLSGLYGPHTFGLDETVKGWTVGLQGMKVGGLRELTLPPPFVYPRWKPSWGYEPYVDVYVVELLGFKPSS